MSSTATNSNKQVLPVSDDRNPIFVALDYDIKYSSQEESNQVREKLKRIDENPGAASFSHRCRLFDVPSLLYDQRWLGTNAVRVELTTATQERAIAIAALVQKAFTTIQATITPVDGALSISDIRFQKKVDPNPIMKLVDFCLWCEPNKIDSVAPENKAAVLSDHKLFSQTLEKEITMCSLDEKMILSTLKKLQSNDNNSGSSNNATSSQSSSQKTSSRCVDMFNRIEKKKQRLTELLHFGGQTAFTNFRKIICCSVCERILVIVSKTQQQTQQDKQQLLQRIAELESKIQQAQGVDLKNKRKKLYRRLKALKSQLY